MPRKLNQPLDKDHRPQPDQQARETRPPDDAPTDQDQEIDQVQEASEDSFPASDPPSSNGHA